MDQGTKNRTEHRTKNLLFTYTKKRGLFSGLMMSVVRLVSRYVFTYLFTYNITCGIFCNPIFSARLAKRHLSVCLDKKILYNVKGCKGENAIM